MTSTGEELDNLLYNIAWLRRTEGLSKREMAKRLGVGRKTLDLMERGEVPPRLSYEAKTGLVRRFLERREEIAAIRRELEALLPDDERGQAILARLEELS